MATQTVCLQFSSCEEKQKIIKYYNEKYRNKNNLLLSLLICLLENEMSCNAGSLFMAPSSSAQLLTA